MKQQPHTELYLPMLGGCLVWSYLMPLFYQPVRLGRTETCLFSMQRTREVIFSNGYKSNLTVYVCSMYFPFITHPSHFTLSHNSETTTTHNIVLTNAGRVLSSKLFDGPVSTTTSDSAVLKKAEKNTSETKFLAASLS